MISAAAPRATPYSGQSGTGMSTDLRSEPTRRVAGTTPPTAAVRDDAQDRITLSQEGLNRSRQAPEPDTQDDENRPAQQAEKGVPGAQDQLSREEQQTVRKLKQRDVEVKTHEAAHLANAGQYATGGPSYSYQTGPDGKKYAVGGEVPIDISKEKTPEQTVQKMRTVRRAALAPAHPSSADRSIAATASMAEAEARREIHSPENNSGNTESSQKSSSTPEQSPAENSVQQPLNRREFQGLYA